MNEFGLHVLERELGEYVGHTLGDCFLFLGGQGRSVPDLEMRPHAEQHHFARQASGGSQFRGNQNPPGGVQLDILRVAEKQALQCASLHRERSDLVALFFPHGSGIQQETSIRVTGERQATFSLRRQSIAMARRYGDPSLRIQRQRAAPLKHSGLSPRFYTKTYFFPLYGNAYGRSSEPTGFSSVVTRTYVLFLKLDKVQICRKIRGLQGTLKVPREQGRQTSGGTRVQK